MVMFKSFSRRTGVTYFRASLCYSKPCNSGNIMILYYHVLLKFLIAGMINNHSKFQIYGILVFLCKQSFINWHVLSSYLFFENVFLFKWRIITSNIVLISGIQQHESAVSSSYLCYIQFFDVSS